MSAREVFADTALPWAAIADALVITADDASDALTALETQHARSVETQRRAAERLLYVATGLGRADLRRRARLVIADVTIRQGDPVTGSALARAVKADAEKASDAFAVARSYFLLAWVARSIGDAATAQVDGIRSVELLPSDTHRGIVVDHLLTLARSYNPAPEAARYYDEALAVARELGDPVVILAIHNNGAYSALDRGDLTLAAENVTAILQVAAEFDLRLPAIFLDTIAHVYNKSGQYAEAIAMLEPIRQAMYLPLAEANDIVDTKAHGLTMALVTMARAHRHLGQLDMAEEVLHRARALAMDAGPPATAASIIQEQALIHAARGEFEKALAGYIAFHEATETLRSEDWQARTRIVQASFDAERNREQADHFRDLAMRDALTGLYNRRYMDELLTIEIAKSASHGTPLSVAILDADHFKRINDECSHEVGDKVLRMLATVLLATRPEPATVCRLGGEEFVLAMPNTAADVALDICETVRSAVAAHHWPMLDGRSALTISIGVSTAVGATSPSSLLSNADRNLYAAKRSGRNRVMADAN
ncbi:MAG: GGDEF domain-containing protein [Nakamurella sp.]